MKAYGKGFGFYSEVDGKPVVDFEQKHEVIPVF
jgi:hypothetical protein